MHESSQAAFYRAARFRCRCPPFERQRRRQGTVGTRGTASHQLRRLESDPGIELLQRTNRGLRITRAGESRAAAEGLAIAIGYLELIQRDLQSGSLVTAHSRSVRHGFSYCLVYAERQTEDPGPQTFLDRIGRRR